MKGWYLLKGMVLAMALFALPLQADQSYRLGPGDHIDIRVHGQDDLALSVQLTDSGTINYPFLGTIQLAGLTLKEVEQLLHNGLQGDYLVSPSVYVGITEYRPFYIHGEVRRPGGYPYQPGMTVNQAIALAGGLTERASRDRIQISREGQKNEPEQANVNSRVFAGDTITISQRFF
ncbi:MULTISPECIES: polysaccharide biosynthesis/export family protein [Alkalimonas]|uniref:Polysaccharide biosynthesis/export family protein n=1 Tax=Alkalimonas mucilaginosa TaxID=3057676 RepID=A0ABU7JFN0_9GAMM|nr:polysaccharide biosynthesis/export family protein [Alkalimonas sp. MEB004]MEE2024492.1 polysaccharide biosynthesis/export family protein [Alkalimonas sp. MEB004]